MIMFYLSSIMVLAFFIYFYRVIVTFPKLALSYDKDRDDKLFLMAERNNFTEIVYSAFPIAALLIIIKVFFMDVVTIPSGSMLPNYPVGSMVFINKVSFGIRSP